MQVTATSAPALNRRQQARWQNARRFGERLQYLLSKGYLVVDDDGSVVKGSVVFEGFRGSAGVSLQTDPCCRHVLFDANPELANGMEMTVKQFNEHFSRWQAYPPRASVPLLRRRRKQQIG